MVPSHGFVHRTRGVDLEEPGYLFSKAFFFTQDEKGRPKKVSNWPKVTQFIGFKPGYNVTPMSGLIPRS